MFTDLAAYGIKQFKPGGANEVEEIWGEVVSGNYFNVIYVQSSLRATKVDPVEALRNS